MEGNRDPPKRQLKLNPGPRHAKRRLKYQRDEELASGEWDDIIAELDDGEQSKESEDESTTDGDVNPTSSIIYSTDTTNSIKDAVEGQSHVPLCQPPNETYDDQQHSSSSDQQEMSIEISEEIAANLELVETSQKKPSPDNDGENVDNNPSSNYDETLDTTSDNDHDSASLSSGWSFFDEKDYEELVDERDRNSNDEESESDHSDLADELADLDFSFMDNLDALEVHSTATDLSPDGLLKKDLADWVVRNKIRQTHATELLHILHPFMGFLPKDVRTLLKSMRKVIDIKEVPPGRYYHFGVVPGLTTVLESLNLPNYPEIIEIYLSFDGMPLYKSAKKKFVPVTASLRTPRHCKQVATVGIYEGDAEPKDFNDLLIYTVDECVLLETLGFPFRERQIPFKVYGILADAVARAAALKIASHNGTHGCHKCKVVGIYVRKDGERRGRTTFRDVNAPERTDADYRQRNHPEHHHTGPLSVLTKLKSLDIVKAVPSEPMHLFDIGLQKKILLWFTTGKNTNARLKKQQVEMISDHLVSLNGDIPLEFARRHPRGLRDLCRFKGTELHFILHHAGPIIFKEALLMGEKTRRFYDHYLLLHTAVRILGDEELFRGAQVIECCKRLLKQFVAEAAEDDYYGSHFISYNVHNSIHVPDDTEFFDRPLYEFSCYANENHLQTIKALVVSYTNELEQAVKRVDELRRNSAHSNNARPASNRSINLFSSFSLNQSDIYVPEDFDCPIPGTSYRKVTCGPIGLGISHPHNTVRIRSTNEIFCISNVFKTERGELILFGHRFRKYDDYFHYPFPSSRIGTWKVSDLDPNLSSHRIEDVKCKCVKLKESYPFIDGAYVVSPIPIFSNSMNNN